MTGLQEWRYLQWTPEEHEWRWDALSKHLTHLIIFSLEVTETAVAQLGPPPNWAHHPHLPPLSLTLHMRRSVALTCASRHAV